MNPQGSQHEGRSQGQAGNAVGPERRLLVVEDEFFLAVQIEECPDLVIMDIRLASESDGVAAALAILERTGIRCIFATAYADAATRERGEKARPFSWLRKPFTADTLLAAVETAFDSLER